MGAYLVVGFFAYVLEHLSENNRKQLKEINGSLEKIIDARTSELTWSSEQLKKEIKERITA